jgi:AraC-like DNA-binding protein
VEIALDLGFADQAQFTRAFRRVSGVTPRACRERQRRSR